MSGLTFNKERKKRMARKPKPHTVFQNDEERIEELLVCLRIVRGLIMDPSTKSRNPAAILGQIKGVVEGTLTWYVQDQKYLTQTAKGLDANGHTIHMIESLVTINKDAKPW
jgi:hypothetical protein